jgi:hypothetical protein
MTSFTKTGVRLVLALSVATHPVRAIAASNPLSFTAHSLNLNPIDTVRLLALDGEGAAYQVATVIDSSGRAWLRVTKTSPQGAVVASFQFGGSGRDVPVAMKVDAQGEVVVAGWTSSTDFPITTSLVTDIQTGAAFVVKLDSGLAGIIASTLIGGGTTAGALDVDSAGNIYLAGSTSAMDFPVTPGAYQTTPPGHDVFGAASFGFLAEISPGLNKIIFATYYGSNNVNCMGSDCLGAWGQTSFTALAVDPSGAIVASAYVYLSAVTPTFGSTTVKFAPGGGSVLWNTPISPSAGGGSQYIDALALDGSGAVVVAGTAYWGSAATAGALQSCDGVNPSGGFIAKLSGLSGAIQFLTYFGCESTPWAFSVNGVAIGAADAILTAGMADPSALPVTPASASGPSYLAVVAPDGSSVEQLYTAPAGIFDRAVALASGGTPVVLGSGGLLMLASSSGGPSLVGVANSAASTASGLIAPAELVSFYGSDLGPATPLNAQVVEGIVQSTFGGYELLIGDTPAPLLYMGRTRSTRRCPAKYPAMTRCPSPWSHRRAASPWRICPSGLPSPKYFRTR